MPEQRPNMIDEMGKMPYEPLLPVEKKLIAWSLTLGLVLLVVLAFTSRMLI
jgi:hypothetical protein